MEAVHEFHRGTLIHPGVIVGDLPCDDMNFGRASHCIAALEAPVDEYKSRLQTVREAMASLGLDVLCVKNEDLRYMTGFHTLGDSQPQTLLVPLEGRPVMVARLLETNLVEKYTWVSQWWSCLDSADPTKVFAKALESVLGSKDGGTANVGLDLNQVSVREHMTLQESNPQVRFVDSNGLVEKIRLKKTPFELTNIATAMEQTKVGIVAGLAASRRGALLSDIYLTALQAMFKAGCSEPAYMPIIRSSDPSGHGTWEVYERCGVDSGIVFIELSGNHKGHHAPRMQTAFLLSDGEDTLPDWIMEAEQKINEVFDTCLPMMKPGVKPSEVDAVAKRIMNSNTFNGVSSARLGYTVGGTATAPAGNAGWGDACFSISMNNHIPFEENMVFHFIPWFEVSEGPHRGPVGLSDTVVVTAEGARRVGGHKLQIIPLLPSGDPAHRLLVDNVDESACLSSDNASGVHPDVMLAMQRCNIDATLAYGGDKYTASAIRCLKSHFGDDVDAYIVGTGTAANVLAISSLIRPYQTILCSSVSHLATDECGAPERFCGCKLIPIYTHDGKLTPESLLPFAVQLLPIPHRSQPGIISITQPNEFGQIYTADEIRKLVNFAHNHSFLVHVDGSRLANAVARLDATFKGLTFDLGVDVVSFGGTKSGLEGAEVVLFRKPNPDFKYVRKQGMQLLSKVRFAAAQFTEWLGQSELWFRIATHAHDCAIYLRDCLGKVAGFSITRPVETNMVIFSCPVEILEALRAEYRFLVLSTAPVECRLVTSFLTTRGQIDRFVSAATEAVANCQNGGHSIPQNRPPDEEENSILSPYTGNVVGRYVYESFETVTEKISNAHVAQKQWELLKPSQRIAVFTEQLDVIISTMDSVVIQFAKEVGKTVSAARQEIEAGVGKLRYLAKIAQESTQAITPAYTEEGDFSYLIQKPAKGVIYTIAPWNYPFFTALNSIGPALLSGNAVILKHETTPCVGEFFQKVFNTMGGISGLCQHVNVGIETSNDIIQKGDIHHVVFTGSVLGGQAIYKQVARRAANTFLRNPFIRVSVELGGSDAVYIAADADIDHAVNMVINIGRLHNSGQSCCSIKRAYVHKSVENEFLRKSKEAMESHVLGDPLDEKTTLGPLHGGRKAVTALKAMVDDAVSKGAQVITGGRIVERDTCAFIEPTLLTHVSPDMCVLQQEVFGPVLPVITVESDEEALGYINHAYYGLTTSVFTQNKKLVDDFISNSDSGTVFVNWCNDVHAQVCWSGVGHSGNTAAALSNGGFDELTKRKSVVSHKFRIA
mmetsp:Transcript_657/g.1099  ORF Transcript_657/g.1099 Transcript_657/m.1099 type:complete len:1279 (+) Transcript_657:98-3934(+)